MKTLELKTIGLDALAFSERPTPSFGPRDLLLRTRAVSLNYRDVAIARGEYGRYSLPLILGSDAVAEIVQIGPAVTQFAIGDRVCPNDTPDWISGGPDDRTTKQRLGGPLDGVLAEFFVASESAVVRAPGHLTDEEASTLCGAGVTAWQALYPLGHLTPGQTVVVQGTGGVSLFALQLARLGGAAVIATSRSSDKLTRVRELGATDLIDTRVHADWQAEVLRLTHGRGADVVIDVVGGASLGRSIAAARLGGTVVSLGFLESQTSTVDLPTAIRRAVTLCTSTGRSREAFEALNRAVEVSGMRPVVDRVFPFAEAREAFEYMASGAQFGKVVVRFA
jgi:NADPH:quinone reductase-like Zn-dependent oxidoreductase